MEEARRAGADLAITYLNERALPFVRPCAEALDVSLLIELDVSRPDLEERLFDRLREAWGTFDILVHSIAFAPHDDLHGPVADVSSAGFAMAMDISVHSFIRTVGRARLLMQNGGACLCMSFYGAEKVVHHYNVMGPVKAALEATTRELAAQLGEKNITVNALSPGPIATRAAGGIDHFDELLSQAASRSPMRRLATVDDVGAAAAFLASDLARNITGCVLHVDAGYHIMG